MPAAWLGRLQVRVKGSDILDALADALEEIWGGEWIGDFSLPVSNATSR
jgi:hypothetical protein